VDDEFQKNAAFLDFPDRVSAAAAFARLQGIGDVCGKRIRVEYAAPNREALARDGSRAGSNAYGRDVTESADTSRTVTESAGLQTSIEPEPIAPKLGYICLV
jgi:hypothetical protein